jgi:hypothetical protein
VSLALLALWPLAEGWRSPPLPSRARLLAGWQTVGGCGAGASTGAGGGIKWIGRNVTGGLFRIETQGNYIAVPYGYNYVVNALISRDLTEKWNLGVAVPYLYKHMNNPFDRGFHVTNRGLGDVNLLVTRKLGAINATTVTAGVGLPTGKHDATLITYPEITIEQDRQLGLGKPTASLSVDHVFDELWGLMMVGGMVNWRGGENALRSYRAPSATGHGYLGYFLGPLTPAFGLQVTGLTGHDRDRGAEQKGTPLFSVAPSLSLEWSSNWVAVMLGASVPYQYDGVKIDEVANRPRNPWGLGPWMLVLGLAVSPF